MTLFGKIILKFVLLRNLINFFFPFNKNNQENIKIAVNFPMVYNLEGRSDFFWYDKKIFSKRVITYFESETRIKKIDSNKKDGYI